MSVELIIHAKEKDLGDNFFVRRSLPNVKKRMVGPFIFWDHMGPADLKVNSKMKVRAHPHIGLATITYLFSGEILHRDTLGTEQMILPGEVNWMTSGSGIAHSETTEVKDKNILLEGIQLWVALPKQFEDVDASFSHFKEKDLPSFQCSNAQVRLVAGQFNNNKSPIPVYSDLFYLSARINKAGDFKYQLTNEQEGAVYIANGEAMVDGELLPKYTMVIFKKGSLIQFSSELGTQFMLLGGTPFPEERHIWWNFVSSEKSKIEAAKLRWEKDQFGQVINETERIPLPKS